MMEHFQAARHLPDYFFYTPQRQDARYDEFAQMLAWMRKNFNPAEHPKGDDGRFVEKGKKAVSSNNQIRKKVALQTPLIDDIQPLYVTQENAADIARKYIDNLAFEFRKPDRGRCKALNNRKVKFNRVSYSHLFTGNKKKRSVDEAIKRIKILPFIPKIIEETVKVCQIRESKTKHGNKDYNIVGRALIDNKEFGISIILTDYANDDLLYLSIFEMNWESSTHAPRPLQKSHCLRSECHETLITYCGTWFRLPSNFHDDTASFGESSSIDNPKLVKKAPESIEGFGMAASKTSVTDTLAETPDAPPLTTSIPQSIEKSIRTMDFENFSQSNTAM